MTDTTPISLAVPMAAAPATFTVPAIIVASLPTTLKRIAALMNVAEISWVDGVDKKQHVLDELKKDLSPEDYAAIEPIAIIAIELVVILSQSKIDISKINATTGGCKACCLLS